jgi:LmbE family N-acetylglucosaminyl deacetylase
LLSVDLRKSSDSTFRILCLGAHCDDIEIGCGGTVLKLTEEIPALEFCWVVFGSNQQRAQEAHNSAAFLLKDAKQKQIIIQDFKDGFFPFIGAEIKEYFEQLKQRFFPHLIFTHYRNDLHQDHRLISDLTWNTFRDHLILEYEVPKYDGDLGTPNFYVHLNERFCRNKVECVLGNFKTQAEKHWFTEDTFMSLLRLRGIESAAPEKYAEAFYCRKIVL